ncbi:hypothetical protein DFH06DRAFT_1171230, partial [Mycena polygramma]
MGGIIHGMGLLLRFCKARSVHALDVAVRKAHLLSQRDSETQSTPLGALEILGGERHCASTGTRRYCRTHRRAGSHTILRASLCQRGVHTLVLRNPCPARARYLRKFDSALTRCRSRCAQPRGRLRCSRAKLSSRPPLRMPLGL